MSGTFSVDVFSCIVSSNEGNGLDIRMLADLLSCLETSLDYIEDSFGQSDLLSEFG